MIDRESILPLSIGALIAVALHLVLLPAMAVSWRDDAADLAKMSDVRLASLDFDGRWVAGREARLRLTIRHDGDTAQTGSPILIRLFLSDDDQLDPKDQALTELKVALPVSGETTAVLSHIVQLDAGVAGPKRLLAFIDATDVIEEGFGEENNLTAHAVRLFRPEEIAKPDLVMLTATSPSAVKPGQRIDVEFAVGGASDSEPVVASWMDGVFLSADDRLDAQDELLSATPGPHAVLTAGLAYARKATVVIDADEKLPGDKAYLLFVADHLGRIDELNESNNLLAKPIRLLRPGAPIEEDQPRETTQGKADLHVPVFTAPDTVMNGETLAIDFIIANRGDGTTGSSGWRDVIHLSKDDQLDESDLVLATLERRSPLTAGGHYSAREIAQIDLPEDESGPRFLIIKTDAGDAVQETDESNNIHVRPIQVQQLVLGKDKPDDVRTAVAWIPYDDFRKLQALASSVEQPALQNKTDPVKDAPTPRDPTPPSPPQPRPVETASTKRTEQPTDPKLAGGRRQPDEEPEDPARRIESKSPVTSQATTPVEQPKAEALAMLPVPPRPQPAAQGPVTTGNPVRQPQAQADRPETGAPTTQAPIALPTPIAPTIDPSATLTKEDGRGQETRDPSRSDVTTMSRVPVQQPRADAPQPIPGAPARSTPSDAPPSDAGDATKLPPAQTKEPSKDGAPMNSPDQQGKVQPQPRPSAEAEDPSKAKPKTDDEKTVKPTPPAQPSNPTSAPRDESDVPPTILEDRQYAVEPGGVITRPGIQIVASTPDITTPSWLVSGPTAVNPIVRITFDRQGNVRKIDMIRSTGHANLDSPIKASFFNFRAKGEALKKVRESFTIEIKLLLKNDRD